jgi:hypothetical protein
MHFCLPYCLPFLKNVLLSYAVAEHNVEIDQIEPEQIVSARDRHSSRDVFVRFSAAVAL